MTDFFYKNRIKKKMYGSYERILEFRTRSKRNYLKRIKSDQKERYDKLIKEFPEIYKEFSKYNIDKFIIPVWKYYNKKLEKSFLSSGFSFLRNPVIRTSMFINRRGKLLKEEVNYLETNVEKEELKQILEEESVGNPVLLNSKYLTSHSVVNVFYHLVLFSNKTQKSIEDFQTIVEWGGGYGNLCRIFMKLKSFNCTYTLIDLPLFSCIQWIYLSSVFGEDKVNLIKNSKCKLKKGKINILPLCFLKNFKLDSDFFISTWGLSESSKYSQDYVKENNFFNAKHFLLGFTETSTRIPTGGRMIELFKNKNLDIFPVKNQERNYYAFK